MKRKRFTEPQIHGVLKEMESGVTMTDVCRKHGISEQTVYRWRAKYGGMELSDLRHMKELEHENSELKRLVANQALEIQATRAVLKKL